MEGIVLEGSPFLILKEKHEAISEMPEGETRTKDTVLFNAIATIFKEIRV